MGRENDKIFTERKKFYKLSFLIFICIIEYILQLKMK
jgi:hypothetical protein